MLAVKSWCLLLLLAVAGAACHTRPPATAPSRTTAIRADVPARPPTPPAPRPPAAAARPAAVAPLTEAELFQRKSLSELNAERPLADAFFDYDQNTLRDDARQVLQQDAQWLAKWPQTLVRVDGHCDERGSAEYNLALGNRRAATVRDYLTSLGVRPDRIQTRSLGTEAPFCRESGESCWSQNRRGHFEITGK
jgi:peptidoglycan-associated lipoprotein